MVTSADIGSRFYRSSEASLGDIYMEAVESESPRPGANRWAERKEK